MTELIDKPTNFVTASELVRHFGLWQERAARAPVYVMFRGRPRLVITSVEMMEALVAPHVPAQGTKGPDVTALFDLIRDMVIIVDADMRVVVASRTARAYFGENVAAGVVTDALVSGDRRDVLLRACRYVQTSGVAQTIDLPSVRSRNRMLTITIEPHRQGVAMLLMDQG